MITLGVITEFWASRGTNDVVHCFHDMKMILNIIPKLMTFLMVKGANDLEQNEET